MTRAPGAGKHQRQPRSAIDATASQSGVGSPSGGRASGAVPAIGWLLPYAVLIVPTLLEHSGASPHDLCIPLSASGVLTLLMILGPLQLQRGHGDVDASRRVVLWALLAVMTLYAACAAYVDACGLHTVLGVWPAVAPIPAWLVFSLLIPLWCDSEAIQPREPASRGWRRLETAALWYSAAEDRALWVRYPRNTILSAGSATFSPNLGTPDGRLTLATLLVLVATLFVTLLCSAR